MPTAHPPKLRRQALALVAQGISVGRTAGALGISESCLRNWVSRDRTSCGLAPGLTNDERRELVELRDRVRVLEVEKEILERASAYFARGLLR